MTIHLYLDEALTQQVSEGGFSNPEADSYNGTDGGIKDRRIFVANEQTRLAAAIDAVQTSISLVEARFAEGELIIVDGEQMQIESAGGTTNPTVRRGIGNTTPAAHIADVSVYSGYDYTGLVIDPIDETGTDESVWYRLSLTQGELDAAVQGAPLTLGDKSHNQTISFWRRCTVLAGTPVQNKLDIKLRLTGTQNPIL